MFPLVFALGITAFQQTAALSDGVKVSTFGATAALSGDTAVVGGGCSSHLDDASPTVVRVYQRDGASWSQQGPALAASPGADLSRFGCSVALSGDTLLLGAQSAVVNTGELRAGAYVFVRNGGVWQQQGSVFPSSGLDLALSGDTLVLFTGSQTLAIYVREGDVWAQQQLLKFSTDSETYAGSLVLSGDTLAFHTDEAHGDTAYNGVVVYARSGGVWSKQGQTLFPAAPCDTSACAAIEPDSSTISLALSADTLVVGDRYVGSPDLMKATGAAYVYTRIGSAWARQGPPLFAAQAVGADLFGSAVAVSGDTALVAAQNTQVGTTQFGGYVQRGVAYAFARTGGAWAQQGGPIMPTVNATDFSVAMTVAVSGDNALLAGTGFGEYHGGAYLFSSPVPAGGAGQGGSAPVQGDGGVSGSGAAGGDSGAAGNDSAGGAIAVGGGEIGSSSAGNAAQAGANLGIGGAGMSAGAAGSGAIIGGSSTATNDSASACGCRLVGRHTSPARSVTALALLALPCMLRRRLRGAIAKGQPKS